MPPQRLALWLAAALAAVVPVNAPADLRIYGQISGVPALAPGVGFALHLAREDLALDYGPGQGSEDLELRRIGFTLSEAIGERARVGARLGSLWTSQSGRAATAQADPRGHYLDLALAADYPLGGAIRGTFDASWRYAAADASDADAGEVDVEWQSWTLQPGLRWRAWAGAAVRAGASLVAIDGDERWRGPDGSTRTEFDADGYLGGYLALDLYPRPDDVISFQVESGPRTGVSVSFEHRY